MTWRRHSMRCLLLHPEDDPLTSEWAAGPWDRVLDVGVARAATYKAWSESLGCDIEPYPRLGQQDFAGLRAMYSFGLGHVVDEFGLDWWDLIWIRWLAHFVDFLLASRFIANASDTAEFFVRSRKHARMLEALAPGRVHCLGAQSSRGSQNALERLRRLTFRQVLEIVGDKYDGSYRWRRLLARRMANCGQSVVLVPSAYGNASRTARWLASKLPGRQFLLLATRQSALIEPLPKNMTRASLSAYACGEADGSELRNLIARWKNLRRAFRNDPAFAVLHDHGYFDDFEHYLCEGLAIRNCWTTVLREEPVAAFLCPDEKNPYTRIPIQLARKRGIKTVSCHHGALDGRYRFTDICADQFLAKSDMEWDYLVNVCRAPKEVVQRAHYAGRPVQTRRAKQEGDNIVFFSEPYEAFNCRTREVYAELLPGLARLAKQHARKLIIKLHPFESLRDCRKIANDVLSRADRSVIRFVAGPLSHELIRQAWFCITVSSSAAVDCAEQGVPAFLCLWLDQYGFGYGEQFVKFGAAMALQTADEIAGIPGRLEQAPGARAEGFSSEVSPELLNDLLFSNAAETADQEASSEKLWA